MGRGINCEVGTRHIHTTIYEINNKCLLSSLGNATQYFIITHKGKESEKHIEDT